MKVFVVVVQNRFLIFMFMVVFQKCQKKEDIYVFIVTFRNKRNQRENYQHYTKNMTYIIYKLYSIFYKIKIKIKVWFFHSNKNKYKAKNKKFIFHQKS